MKFRYVLKYYNLYTVIQLKTQLNFNRKGLLYIEIQLEIGNACKVNKIMQPCYHPHFIMQGPICKKTLKL